MLNLEGRIGGDAELSHRGEEYARKLPQLVRASVGVSFIFFVLFFSSMFYVFPLREHIIIVRPTNDPVPVPSAEQPPPSPHPH